jgi:hypothetical protein
MACSKANRTPSSILSSGLHMGPSVYRLIINKINNNVPGRDCAHETAACEVSSGIKGQPPTVALGKLTEYIYDDQKLGGSDNYMCIDLLQWSFVGQTCLT